VRGLEAERKFWACLWELDEEMMFYACAEVTAVGTRGRVNNRSVKKKLDRGSATVQNTPVSYVSVVRF